MEIEKRISSEVNDGFITVPVVSVFVNSSRLTWRCSNNLNELFGSREWAAINAKEKCTGNKWVVIGGPYFARSLWNDARVVIELCRRECVPYESNMHV